jgi:hypothetical protein
MQLCPPDFLTKAWNTYYGEKGFSTNVAGKTGYLHEKIKTRSMSFTLYRYHPTQGGLRT